MRYGSMGRRHAERTGVRATQRGHAAGSLAGRYVLSWKAGESMTVSIGVHQHSLTLPPTDGPGSMAGLFGA